MTVTVDSKRFILSGHMPGQPPDRPDKSFAETSILYCKPADILIVAFMPNSFVEV